MAKPRVTASEKRVPVCISLPMRMVQELGAFADSEDLPVSRIAERALTDHLAAFQELAS